MSLAKRNEQKHKRPRDIRERMALAWPPPQVGDVRSLGLLVLPWK